MDLRRMLAVALSLVVVLGDVVSGNVVFRVKHKFAGRERDLSALKSHDANRHSRILAALDLPLGGDSRADSAGLYFTKIGLGTPSKDYYVQVDTGSDILWVNCAECTTCPRKTDLEIPLTLYDTKQSSTSKVVRCEEDFCTLISQKSSCRSGASCPYMVVYGDGSSTDGYFVRDTIQLEQVTGNLQTRSMNGSVVFGCGAKQSGQLGQSQSAVDGIIGFGQSNSSILSQLAVEGKAKRSFAHCLDNVNGGGIFTIGEVVSPKVKTTPMVPNRPHYNVILKAIAVSGDALDLPTDAFDGGENGGTIIDSGTTLAYLPQVVYDSMMKKILARQPGLKMHLVQETFSCFDYDGDIGKGFPDVSFHFEDDASITVHPHDYLFELKDGVWCFGWQAGGMQSKDGSQLTLLGDMVLHNKLFVYDIDNEVIGWTVHNCSSTIKLKDSSGAVYSVGADNLSSSYSLTVGWLLTFFSMLIAMVHCLTSQ